MAQAPGEGPQRTLDFYPPPSASSCHPRNCFPPPSLPANPADSSFSSLLSPRPHHRRPSPPPRPPRRPAAAFIQNCASIPLTRDPRASRLTRTRVSRQSLVRGPLPRGQLFCPGHPHLIVSSPPFIPNLVLSRRPHFLSTTTRQLWGQSAHPPGVEIYGPPSGTSDCSFAYNRL